MSIYAPAGSHSFNAALENTLYSLGDDVRQAVGQGFTALVLGGGYGRGEGAVVPSNDGERPYNDLDLFLIAERLSKRAKTALNGVRHRYERRLSVNVDIAGPYPVSGLRDWTPRLMWFDLLNGHKVLAGKTDVLSATPEHLRDAPAQIEATRLLLNRGAGLLWAMRVVRGLERAQDRDFVIRNVMKCTLALGDAVLLAHGRYATPVTKREQQLRILDASNPAVEQLDLTSGYHHALRFKLSPNEVAQSLNAADLLQSLTERWSVTLLHVESMRTGMAWASPREYAAWSQPREHQARSVSDLGVNLIRNAATGRLSALHPREQLYREIPSLLNDDGTSTKLWDRRSARALGIWDAHRA